MTDARAVFAGIVTDDGKLVYDDPKRERHVRMGLRGKRFTQTLGRERKTRSLSANNYLWGVCYARIAEETGNDPADVHLGMKELALRAGVWPGQTLVDKRTGECLLNRDVPASSADSDSKLFAGYIDFVRRTAAEWGIYVPDPRETEFPQGSPNPGMPLEGEA